MKKQLLSLALAASMVITMAGCGSKDNTKDSQQTGGQQTQAQGESQTQAEGGLVKTLSKPVTLEYWHCISNETHIVIVDQLIKDFNEGRGKELGITVNPSYQGSEADLQTKVLGALKAGSPPDVTLSTPPFTSEYVTLGYVKDLTPYIFDEEVGIKDWEDIFEGFRKEGANYAVDGIYSLPVDKSAEILYYNKKFFEENQLEPPKTWNEMVELSQKIYDITGKPAFGWDNLWSAFMTLNYQFGGQYADREGNVQFLQDPAVAKEVLTFFKGNIDKGIWRTTGEDKYFSGPFANEIIPMYIGVCVEASYINMKSDTIQWSAVPIPQKDPNKPYVRTDGHCIEILNMDGDQEKIYAAYEFVKYMTSYEANLANSQGSGYLPIRQSVLDAKEYQEYLAKGKDDAQIAAGQQTSAYYNPPAFVADGYSSRGLGDDVKVMMSDVLDNGIDIDTALQNLKNSLGIK